MRPSLFKLPLLTVVLLLSAGCASYAGLHPEGQIATPSKMASELTFGGRTSPAIAWPNEKWWERFGDQQLNTLIEEALEKNPGIAEASARARRASAIAALAGAVRGPRADADFGISRSRLARPDDFTLEGNRYISVNALDVRFEQVLDLWGGKRKAWEASLGNALAADIDTRASRLGVVANVTKAYNQLVFAYEVLDFAREDSNRLTQMLRIAKLRYDFGADDRFRISLLSGMNERAIARVSEADNEVSIARLQLAALIGGGLDRSKTIARPSKIAMRFDGLPNDLPAELLGRRPDIVAARLRVTAAFKNVQSLKTDFYPNVNLLAFAGLHSFAPADILASASRFWRVAPAISLPIFDAGRLRSNLRVGHADFDISVALYNQTLNGALHEVAGSASELRALDERIPRLRNSSLDAERTAILMKDRFTVGDTTMIDYLDVQEQVINSQLGLAVDEHRRINVIISLLVSLGGGALPARPEMALLRQND